MKTRGAAIRELDALIKASGVQIHPREFATILLQLVHEKRDEGFMPWVAQLAMDMVSPEGETVVARKTAAH